MATIMRWRNAVIIIASVKDPDRVITESGQWCG
jgi:hypothetical protein